MFHEIRSDNGELGVRTDGYPPIYREDGDVTHGRITLDNCRQFGYWPELTGTEDPQPHAMTREVPEYVKNDAEQNVYRNVTWTEIGLQQAADQVKAALESRWNDAMLGGVPVQGNGQVVKLAYDERARNLYAAIPEDPAKRPPEGMPVRLLEPFNGKILFDIKGDPKFDAVETATFAHRCAGNRAWARGYTDVDEIVAGTGYKGSGLVTDEEKVQALEAYIVETLGGRTELPPADPNYAEGWPSNEVPRTT